MPSFSRSWLMPFLCIFLYGCSFMPNEIKTAERIMDTNPDSALHILQHMHTEKLMLSSSDRALYGLLLFQALDKNSKPLKPDSVINFSLNYYQNSNDKHYLAMCFFYKARTYKNAQQYDQATIMYFKALDAVIDKKDNNMLGKIYSDMGFICSFQKDYKEALKKYRLSSECFNRAGKIINANYSILDIGRTYRLAHDYKSALIYFRKALTKPTDSIFYGFAIQEIGINYYYAKQLDSAQFYLRKSLRFPFKSTNYAIRCYFLADLFFDLEKYDSAHQYASLALKYPSNYFTQRECFRLLANTEYLKGNFKQMAVFMTQFQSCSDSVREVESQTKITVLEDLHQTSVIANKTKKYLIVLGWILPIVILIGIYIFFLLRKKSKGKERQLEETEVQLEEVEVQLSERQNLFIDSLIHQLHETRISQATAYKKATTPQREQLDKDLYNNCLHVNDWDAFKRLMNKTFNNIITSLEGNYSDVTKKELTWCCLFLLDIPNQDIAIILDSQPGSLYKLKSRLTQKMNLNSTKELDQLLKEKSLGK